MDPVVLMARPRPRTGKGGARTARREGMVPAVLYGHQAEPRALNVNAREFGRLLRDQGTAPVVRLQFDGDSSEVALIKDVQREPVTHLPLHIDFQIVSLDETVTVTVPLEYVGDPVGVRHGGVLAHQVVELEIECLPLSIPQAITVDQSRLGLGEHLTAGEIELPEGVKLVTDPTQPVAAVSEPSTAEAAETEEAEEPTPSDTAADS